MPAFILSPSVSRLLLIVETRPLSSTTIGQNLPAVYRNDWVVGIGMNIDEETEGKY